MTTIQGPDKIVIISKLFSENDANHIELRHQLH